MSSLHWMYIWNEMDDLTKIARGQLGFNIIPLILSKPIKKSSTTWPLNEWNEWKQLMNKEKKPYFFCVADQLFSYTGIFTHLEFVAINECTLLFGCIYCRWFKSWKPFNSHKQRKFSCSLDSLLPFHNLIQLLFTFCLDISFSTIDRWRKFQINWNYALVTTSMRRMNTI